MVQRNTTTNGHNSCMDWLTVIVTALATGVAGGLLAHVFTTRLFPSRGGYEDHEERLELLESVTRTVQRAQKAERMRQLRSAQAEDPGTLPTPDKDALPYPIHPNAADAKQSKQALRQRVFGATRL